MSKGLWLVSTEVVYVLYQYICTTLHIIGTLVAGDTTYSIKSRQANFVPRCLETNECRMAACCDF